MKTFRYRFKIYSDDTDCFGIVYHTNFIKYMARARNDALESENFHLNALQQDGFIFLIRKISIQYYLPARLNDQLEITTIIKELKKTSFIFQQSVRRNTDLICEAEIQVACTRPDARPIRMPTVLYQEVQQWL